jgi:hypothetical protein
MPGAVAVGPPEPARPCRSLPAPRGYQSHFSHAGERIWPEAALIVNLCPCQANSGIRALAYPSDETTGVSRCHLT